MPVSDVSKGAAKPDARVAGKSVPGSPLEAGTMETSVPARSQEGVILVPSDPEDVARAETALRRKKGKPRKIPSPSGEVAAEPTATEPNVGGSTRKNPMVFWEEPNFEIWQRQVDMSLRWYRDGISRVKSQLVDQEAENKRLLEENDMLRQRIEDVTLQLSNHDAEVEKARKVAEETVTRLTKEVSGGLAEIGRLKKELEDVTRDRDKRVDQIADLTIEMRRLESDRDDKTLAVFDLKQRIAKDAEEIQELKEKAEKVEILTRENASLLEEKKELLKDPGNFHATTRLAFMNCLQQLQLLNPASDLSLKGLSTDHMVINHKLIDLNTNQIVDLSNPDCPTFVVDSPLVEAAESEDYKTGDYLVADTPEAGPGVGSTCSEPGETVIPPPPSAPQDCAPPSAE